MPEAEIEIWPEMIVAVTDELLSFDPDYDSPKEVAERILRSALSARKALIAVRKRGESWADRPRV